VQVLHHEDDRALLGEPGEQRPDQLEQVAPAGLAVVGRQAQLGQQAGELGLAPAEDGPPVVPGQLAQRGRERGERQALLTELEALAEEDAGVGGPAELLDEPGLADPGLTPDEEGGRFVAACPFERVVQRGQVGCALTVMGSSMPRAYDMIFCSLRMREADAGWPTGAGRAGDVVAVRPSFVVWRGGSRRPGACCRCGNGRAGSGCRGR
jgi:hypothetical protein